MHKGMHIKEGEGQVLVGDAIIDDWYKIRKPYASSIQTPQKTMFKEYGERVKSECQEYKNNPEEMKICMTKIRNEVIKKKE